ncbi:autotransporter outer membrane beta-barrel domain-containing protein [Roseovarius sp. C7]|uniref:autotransporter outer membrane beta-barrel domain-containing protein n=1 Tax=Roseovarius sp. C7 TaxID=3398643 RepID=UPI0039F680C5
MHFHTKTTLALALTLGLATPALAAPAFEVTHDGVIDGSQTIDIRFNMDELQITITDSSTFLAYVFSSSIGPSSNETVLLLYRAGEFDPNNFTNNLLTPILHNTAINDPFPEGQYTLPVVANWERDTGTYSLGLIGAILGWGPTQQELLDEMQSAGITLGRLALRQSAGNTSQGARGSFVARDLQSPLSFGDVEDGEAPVISTKNGQLMGNVYAWVNFNGFIARGSANDYSGTGVQLGADISVSPNMVLGLSLGHDELNANTAITSTSGDFTYVQPYLGYRSGAWSGELALLYGQADYKQTSLGGVGRADSDVWAISIAAQRDIALSDMLTFTPMASARYGEEKITGKSGTLAGTGSTTVDYSELSLGARWTRSVQDTLVYTGLHLDYVTSDAPSALAGGGYDPDGVSGRVELGGAFPITVNGDLMIGAEMGGIGSELTNYSGQMRFVFSF